MTITYKEVKGGYIKHGTKRLRRGHVPHKQETTEIERFQYGRIHPSYIHRKHVVKPYVRKSRTGPYKREHITTPKGKPRKTPIVKAPTTKMVPLNKNAKKRKLHGTPRAGRSHSVIKIVKIPTIHVIPFKKGKKRGDTYVDAFNADMDKMFASM